MAFKIIWSEAAREDLREIVQFIALDNPPAAETLGFLLISKADPLATFPELGRIAPEIKIENIRELIHRPYRIIIALLKSKGQSLLCGYGTVREANRKSDAN